MKLPPSYSLAKAISSSILLFFLSCITLPSTIHAEKNSVEVGTEVCVVGYIMDVYCIERGTLLDNSSVKTLSPDGPIKHSVHCLVDVGRCNSSPYEVLIKVENTTDWGRAWRVDNNELILEHSRALGSCTTCSKTPANVLKSGYRATIQGTVKNLGSGDTPALISVSSVDDYEDFDTICDGKQFEVPNMVVANAGAAGTMQNLFLLHGSLMLIGWGILLPSGAIVAKFSKHRENSFWYKVHRVVQPIGLLVAIIGWIIALMNFRALNAKNDPGLSYPHAMCGMVTMVIGIIQPVNALLRPHKVDSEPTTTLRMAWELLHKGLGWIAIILAAVTIWMGTTLLPIMKDQRVFQVCYAIAILGIISLAAFFHAEGQKIAYQQAPKDSTTDQNHDVERDAVGK